MRVLLSTLLLLIPGICLAAAPALDERPATEQEWGYRPGDGSVSAVNPPGFSWRPQSGIVSWELECVPVGGKLGKIPGLSGFRHRLQRALPARPRSRRASTPGVIAASTQAGESTELEPAADVHDRPERRGDAHAAAGGTAGADSQSASRGCSSGPRTCRVCASWPKAR